MVQSLNEPGTPLSRSIGRSEAHDLGARARHLRYRRPDFDLHVTGENFTTASIIYFAGHDEPTTLNEDGTVSTASTWRCGTGRIR
jgi:hypothetical protein